MSVEWLKNNIDSKEKTSEELKTNIDKSINTLKNIDPDNESIQKISDITNKLKDNKEALKIINEWLYKINDNIDLIKQNWLKEIDNIFKSLKNKIELSETTIPNIDEQLKNQ